MNHKVLVVDDDQGVRGLLHQMLAMENFEVLIAQNEEEFREKAVSLRPDLIILDVMLGDKNSVRVYDEMLSEGFNRNIPVLFISGLLENYLPSQARPGRKCALMGKPFKTAELLMQVWILLGDSTLSCSRS